MEKIGWSLRRVAALLSPYDVFPSPNLSLSMNIIVWNSRGVLKPNFQNHVRQLARIHSPTILVIMETKLSGARAMEITDRLPFDGVIDRKSVV